MDIGCFGFKGINNMKDSSKIWNQLTEFWRRKNTNKGLFVLFFFSNSIFFPLIYFAYAVLSRVKVIDTLEATIKFFLLVLSIVFLLNLLLLFIWLYWRQLPIIDSSKNWILFTPHSDLECKDLVFRLFDQFKSDIEKRKLKNFKYKLLSENIIVENHEEAHEILVRSGARLIIYGNVQRGNVQSEKVEGFKSISFTVRHRTLYEFEKQHVMQDLTGAFAYRTFIARDKNNFFEKDLVIENISEVACFFIAMGLTLEGRITESKEILEKLLQKVNIKLEHEKNNPQLRFFKNSIISCLTVALRAYFMFIYEKHLIDNITNREYDIYANQCLEIIEKLISMNKKTSWFYLAIAIIRFHFGDVNSARQAIATAKILSPTNNAAPHFSSAFLNLWDRNYKQALKDYMRGERCTNVEIPIIMEILLFVQGLIKNHPERVDLLFAIAFINDKFFDTAAAINDYRLFLSNSKEKQDMSLLAEYAKRRLDILEKQS
jgi:hypothetical protein